MPVTGGSVKPEPDVLRGVGRIPYRDGRTKPASDAEHRIERMPPPLPPEDDDEDAGRSRRNLMVLLIALAVVAAGVWLVNKMIETGRVQTCLESGRTNCAPIAAPGR